jgi:hypothetical protein
MNRVDIDIQNNLLTGVQFKFEIHNLPHTTFHCQTIIMPSIQLDQPVLATARRDAPMPGSKLSFDPLNIEFIVDADLKNYSELYNWMINIATKEPVMEFRSDATLHILKGDLTKQTDVRFVGCHPTMISELPFASNTNDSDLMVVTTIFNYDYFLLEGMTVL